jgi:TetR/AcrR family transcriptional repressor of mexJK operon
VGVRLAGREQEDDSGGPETDRNLCLLAETLTTLTGRGLLAIDHPDVVAEQFVWLVIGAPLNQLSLRGTLHGYSARRLEQVAEEAIATFLSRYGPHTRRPENSISH